MNGIFKIEQHLPDTKQIVVKFCKANSHKSIDEYGGGVLSSKPLNSRNSFISRNSSFLKLNDPLFTTYETVVNKIF